MKEEGSFVIAELTGVVINCAWHGNSEPINALSRVKKKKKKKKKKMQWPPSLFH